MLIAIQKIFRTSIGWIYFNLHFQACALILHCVGKGLGRGVQTSVECLNLCCWLLRRVGPFLFLSKTHWGGISGPSGRYQGISKTAVPPSDLLPAMNLCLLGVSGCFMLGTICVKVELWGLSCVCGESLLSVSYLYQMLGLCSGCSLQVGQSWATAWNKIKPVEHELVLQKLILFQTAVLLCKILGFVDLAGGSGWVITLLQDLGSLSNPWPRLTRLIPEDGTHKGRSWHLRAFRFPPAHPVKRHQEDLNWELVRAARSSNKTCKFHFTDELLRIQKIALFFIFIFYFEWDIAWISQELGDVFDSHLFFLMLTSTQHEVRLDK